MYELQNVNLFGLWNELWDETFQKKQKIREKEKAINENEWI